MLYESLLFKNDQFKKNAKMDQNLNFKWMFEFKSNSKIVKFETQKNLKRF